MAEFSFFLTIPIWSVKVRSCVCEIGIGRFCKTGHFLIGDIWGKRPLSIFFINVYESCVNRCHYFIISRISGNCCLYIKQVGFSARKRGLPIQVLFPNRAEVSLYGYQWALMTGNRNVYALRTVRSW